MPFTEALIITAQPSVTIQEIFMTDSPFGLEYSPTLCSMPRTVEILTSAAALGKASIHKSGTILLRVEGCLFVVRGFG